MCDQTIATASREINAVHTVVVYGGVCVLGALAYTVLQTVIVAAQRPDSRLKTALGNDLKSKGSMLAYVASVPLAFAWRWGSIAIFVAVAWSG